VTWIVVDEVVVWANSVQVDAESSLYSTRYPLIGDPPSDVGAFHIASKLSAVFGITLKLSGAVAVVAGTADVTNVGPKPAIEFGVTLT
jgi:hypothetical protein